MSDHICNKCKNFIKTTIGVIVLAAKCIHWSQNPVEFIKKYVSPYLNERDLPMLHITKCSHFEKIEKQ